MASRDIKDLHPKLQPIAKEFLKRADEILGKEQAFITDGKRSNAEQTKLYASGRFGNPGRILTYALAGQSPHNYGLAFDIAFRDDGTKQARWTTANYKKLAATAKELGLIWGGTWTGFTDRPHFELANWKNIKDNKVEPSPPKEENMAETEPRLSRDHYWKVLDKIAIHLGIKINEEKDVDLIPMLVKNLIVNVSRLETEISNHKDPITPEVELKDRIETGSEDYEYNKKGQLSRKRSFKSTK